MKERHFLRCLQHGVWGTEGTKGLNNWMKNDMLAFTINKKIAGLAKVTDKHFYSEEVVWSNGLFPYRIPIEFIYVLDMEDRLPMLGKVRDAVTGAWGTHYGWGVLTKSVLPEDAGNIIVNEILSKPNSLAVFQKELSDRIEREEL